jgi:hypothetical protein
MALYAAEFRTPQASKQVQGEQHGTGLGPSPYKAWGASVPW